MQGSQSTVASASHPTLWWVLCRDQPSEVGPPGPLTGWTKAFVGDLPLARNSGKLICNQYHPVTAGDLQKGSGESDLQK